jgi:hypothetical protein
LDFSLLDSLKDAKKNGARRLNKNSQQISIITSDNINPNNHQSPLQPAQTQQQQQHYDNRMNTQVKTYTDHGNGHSVIRTGNSSHYSKVRRIHVRKSSVSVFVRLLAVCGLTTAVGEKTKPKLIHLNYSCFFRKLTAKSIEAHSRRKRCKKRNV